jgi:hypothetical protein
LKILSEFILTTRLNKLNIINVASQWQQKTPVQPWRVASGRTRTGFR